MEGCFIEEMDGEILLYRLGDHNTIRLNESAALIWKMSDGSRPMRDIIAILQAEYPEAETEIASDVQMAVEKLISRKLLTLS